MKIIPTLLMLIGLAGLLVLSSCTQEQQNKFSRSIQNWTGTNFEISDFGANYIFFENPH